MLEKRQHILKILSLHDAQLSCCCGWTLVKTGEMTTKEAIEEHKFHIKLDQIINKPFSVMCPKCEHGFMTDESLEDDSKEQEYKDFKRCAD